MIINEQINNENYVTIIPEQLNDLSTEMRQKYPDEFLGFSILINNIRVSCFNIPYSELSKAIIN